MSRFVRLGETDRPAITVHVDGAPVEALEGDTLMVALLSQGGVLRQSEFGPEKRAGFSARPPPPLPLPPPRSWSGPAWPWRGGVFFAASPVFRRARE